MTATQVVRGVSSIENWFAYEPSAACARSIVSCMNLSGLRRIGFASWWKRSMKSRTAICAAISPPTWPPMPSAMTSSSVSRLYVYAMRSWLTVREPLRDSWKIVNRIALSDFGKELLLQVAEEADLALLRGNVANRLLQCEHRLRALQRIEAQAPVDHFEHVIRILAGPDLLRRNEVILLLERVGRLRRDRSK